MRLIYSGRVLENHRTLAESRLPVGDLHAGDITILVVLRPPVPEGNTGEYSTGDFVVSIFTGCAYNMYLCGLC